MLGGCCFGVEPPNHILFARNSLFLFCRRVPEWSMSLGGTTSNCVCPAHNPHQQRSYMGLFKRLEPSNHVIPFDFLNQPQGYRASKRTHHGVIACFGALKQRSAEREAKLPIATCNRLIATSIRFALFVDGGGHTQMLGAVDCDQSVWHGWHVASPGRPARAARLRAEATAGNQEDRQMLLPYLLEAQWKSYLRGI